MKKLLFGGFLSWCLLILGAQVTGVGNVDGTVIRPLRVLTGNGTLALPSHSFYNDPDTGMYRAAANEITLVLGGVARLMLAGNQVDPGADNTSDFGQTARRWRGIYSYTVNTAGLITTSAGVDHATTGAKPSCDSSARGRTWFTESGAGVADIFEVCRKDAADAYAWTAL